MASNSWPQQEQSSLHLDCQRHVHPLKVAKIHQYQMNSWKFSDIPSQKQQRFYIEFRQAIFNNASDDVGEVTFQLEDTSSSFQLRVRWPYKEGECGFRSGT